MFNKTYKGFIRPNIYLNATTLDNGRLHGSVSLEAFESHYNSETRDVEFAIQSPRDVAGMMKEEVGTVYPTPHATDIETGFLCTAELTEADLPWLYTPVLSIGDVLPPWIVLVIGTNDDEITLLGNGNVQIEKAALNDHDLAESAQWAHVEQMTSGPISRLLSPRRPDKPDTEYIAVIVPAFDDEAQPSWVNDTTNVTLPCFYHWRFHTGTRISFEELVNRLSGLAYIDDTGNTQVCYPRIISCLFEAPGALRPPGADQYPPVKDSIIDDIQELPTPLKDDTGRTAVGVPTYGTKWFIDPIETEWADKLNSHPANRVAAGLGVAAAFHFEDQLVRTTLEQAGDFEIADERIRHLTLGTAASGSLWARRFPQEEHEQLMVLGPSMGRIATTDGSTVLDKATGPERPLAAALFSGAAQRVLRPSSGWAQQSGDGAKAINVLENSNICPISNPHQGNVSSFLDEIEVDWESVIEKVTNGEMIEPKELIDLINSLINDHWGSVPPVVTEVRNIVIDNFEGDRGDWATLLILYLALITCDDAQSLGKVVNEIDQNRIPDIKDTPPSFGNLPPGDVEDQHCAPINLIELAEVLTAAIDPTDGGRVTARVLSTLDGVEDTTPPCIHPYLNIPLWTFLRDCAPEWLIPGLRDIKPNKIAVLKPNPRFIESFMVGANTRLLEALSRYDLRIAPSVTPLKVFWGRFDDQGELQPDICDIHDFGKNDELGNHVLDSGGRVALMLRSPIFDEYPNTRLYLLEASHDINNDPDFNYFAVKDLADPVWPTFQGAVEDIVLVGFDLLPEELGRYWLVFEEDERDPRFGVNPIHDPPSSDEEGASFAARRIVGSYRVVIQASLLLDI